MRKQFSLFLILVISLVGMLFSGYLSFQELIQKTCEIGGCTALFGLPACVYGFLMYFIIFLISIFGMRGKQVI